MSDNYNDNYNVSSDDLNNNSNYSHDDDIDNKSSEVTFDSGSYAYTSENSKKQKINPRFFLNVFAAVLAVVFVGAGTV